MKINELLIGIKDIKVKGSIEKEINKITNNSKEVTNGDMFIAIKGFVTDGHKYIQNAIDNGAIAIVIQDGAVDLSAFSIGSDLTIISIPDTRIGLSAIASNYYDNPSKKMKIIGVTGTKGKTTSTFMIKQMLQSAGHKVGLIGTIATYINDQKLADSARTTPESIELQKILAYMANQGCEYVVMEVSSQSLKLHRVDNINFEIAVFTNFSRDHISDAEHPDMQDYFNSKLKIFDIANMAIINTDDLYGAKIPKMLDGKIPYKTYGIDNVANMLAKDITITNSYVDFRARINNTNERIKVGIPGRFSVYNALCAISVMQEIGISNETLKQTLEKIKVPGRSEMVDNKLEIPIMIDYAHSPDSLKNILEAVKSYTRGRVISVFGCGGNRDTTKRAQMGEISGKIADYTIITSDNPRFEDPNLIVDMIEEGIKKTNGKYEKIVDRTEAIKKAVKMANKRDIIVLAGKGHEPYQEIEDQKYPYDERIIVNQIIKEILKEKK